MDNYTAIAYSVIALKQLQSEGKEITENTLKARMIYLMDMYSENEIYRRHSEGKY